jgi:glucose/arabinose dehydrogenase
MWFSGISCNDASATDAEISAASDNDITTSVLTANLTNVWELVWGPDKKLWITERDGTVSRVDPVTGKVTAVKTIDEVKSRGEGGLLGIALHPDFLKRHRYLLLLIMKRATIKEK